jgi:hypothetical protein
MASHDVKVTPEFRENPDVEKLARALIAVAMSIAQKKEAEEKTTQKSHDEGKGDDMT